jgi:2-desacetyl-2-hydroxyethyl bacteriochlorophyllide A dehydrogenase
MVAGDVVEPVAASGEVVVTVQLAGICGSDVSAYRGTMGIARPGDVRGHEFAGVVSAVGADVEPAWLDRRVTVNSQVTCGRCWACDAGRDNLCPSLQILGVHRSGAFAERVVVPARNLVAVADSLGLELAAGAEPLAQACHDVRLALPAGPGSALVIGAGSIGTLVVQAARLLGITDLTVVEPDPARRVAAGEAGAAVTLATTADAAPAARSGARDGFDVVFDVVGMGATRAAAVDLVRPGGQVVLVGLHTDVTDLPWFSVIRREVALVGANCFDRGDFDQAVTWLTEGAVRPPGTAHHASLEEGPAVFAELAAGRAPAAKTFLVPTRRS